MLFPTSRSGAQLSVQIGIWPELNDGSWRTGIEAAASRQRPSRAKKKGVSEGGGEGRERETKRVTSNGAARSTASFYRARRILLALVVALFPFQRALYRSAVKTNSGKLYVPESGKCTSFKCWNSIRYHFIVFCFIHFKIFGICRTR